MDSVNRRCFIKLMAQIGGASALAGEFQIGTAQELLSMQKMLSQNLLREHPRLHLSMSQWLKLREAIKQDPLLSQWYELLQAQAAKMLTEPPAQYKLLGPRLLYQSRDALRHISTLAGLYLLDDDVKKADRAREELRVICAFPSWHPPHFLDVAEMTNAAALGYDWLYQVLSEDERRTIRSRIVEFGLRPGLEQFANNVVWSRSGANNWGQVCNGGLSAGALAIAGDGTEDGGTPFKEPAELLSVSTKNVRYAMAAYAPDGGWPEGPGYWSYATQYTCYMISALNSAVGRDFGLSEMEGFADAGTFRVASIGPTGEAFNYADASSRVGPAPEMLWLANRFQRPLYAVSERVAVSHSKPNIFHLIWSQPHESAQSAGSPPLDTRFSRINVAYFRTSWSDPNAFFIGVKGGDNAASHGHLDLGTFVMDADGQRWALDLGPDDYDLTGYFGAERWNYYRLRTEGHNTLSLGIANQALKAKAPITDYSSTPERAYATIDLSAAYAPSLQRVERQIMLDRGGDLRAVITDRIRGDSGKVIRWNLHTQAQIAITGSVARLTQGGKTLRARIVAPVEANFTVISADASLPQAQQHNVHNLTIDVPLKSEETQITVEFDLIKGGVPL